MTAQPPQIVPTDVHATFVGIIEQASIAPLTRCLDFASQSNPPMVHLLFQSAGGMVGDGVFLYNYFRNLPFDLTIYNMGAVESAAAIAFFGRKVPQG